MQTEFAKNVVTLTTGTTLAQAIPVAISPILTRLYSPEDFGILALFVAITAICGAISNGKYDMAILLPKKQEDALNLLYLSVLVTIGFSLFLLVIIFLFKSYIAGLLNEPKIENWLFFVPFSVLFIGVFNALNLYNTREKYFKDIATSLVTKSSGLAITQLGLGVVKAGAIGLIAGQIVSFLAGNLILLRRVTNQFSIEKTFNIDKVKNLAKRYVRFPQFTLPGVLMNSATLNLINIIISGVYSTVALGYFSLANRVMGLPMVVIGKSIGQVYFQMMTAKKNSGGNLNLVFINTLKRLSFFAIPIFIIAFFTVEPLFSFVFGEEWAFAGQYAQILVPLAATRFVSSALSPTVSIFEKQHFTIIINFILLVSLFVVFGIAYSIGTPFVVALTYYSALLSIEYILFIFIYWKIVKQANLGSYKLNSK